MRHLRPHHILIPLLATVALVPLFIHGCSCGADQPFHVQSWLDAAQQFRHGTIYPRWAFSPAWQAGEPRFVFYPPLSWFLGALLTGIFPMNAVPIAFTWIALTGAGFSMHHLVRRFASAEAALVCAGVYMANPYMLFNAFQRGAYAELLAAVWIPLVLLSMLQPVVSVVSIAFPLGLVWLTNAPAGVMATYTVCLLGAIRVFFEYRSRVAGKRDRTWLRPLLLFASGIALGLALVSFYLLPAALERRFVQVAMVIIPNLRYQDNFLFSTTAYAPHNQITFAVSVLALVLLAVTFALMAFGFTKARGNNAATANNSLTKQVRLQLLVLTCVIALLLTPVSTPIWEHLPNLKFLQFPWRLLSILSAVLAVVLIPNARRLSGRKWTSPLVALLLVFALSTIGGRLYRQGCDPKEYPAFEAAAFHAGHGVLPTDEYTPGDADNDVQRTDNPGYWLVEGDPNGAAAGTIANPNETMENYDEPIPFANTVASRSPEHLVLTLTKPKLLVLNLRDFPAWSITRNGAPITARVHRDDGLLTVALPAGVSSVDVHWHHSPDQIVGTALSLCALACLGLIGLRSRKMKTQAR